MTYFICYDIANPGRLVKVARTLENFGLRVQYSFFQCDMEEEQLEELRRRLLLIINRKEDSLRIYPLCQDCLKQAVLLGSGSVFIPRSFQIL